MRRPLLVQVFALAIAVGACGGSGTKKDAAPGGGGSGGSAMGGSGGRDGSAAGGTGGTAMGGAGGTAGAGGAGGSGGRDGAAGDAIRSDGGSSVGNAICPLDTSMMCSQADVDSYNNCLADRCDMAFKTCIGDVRNGNYGGPCGPSVMCTNKCACGDMVCRNACPQPTPECLICLFGPGLTCQNSSGCARPACYGPGPDGGMTPIPDGGFSIPDGGFSIPDGGFSIPDGGFSFPEAGITGNCAQLLTCCGAIADPSTKGQCLAAYGAFSMTGGGGDPNCALALTALRAVSACP
jgi:hypothetical protein